MPHARSLLSRLFALCLLAASPAFAQSVAITFDDGPSLAATPRLGAGERNTALLRALAQHFYNSHRLHSVSGKLPPSVYERTMAAKEAIAVSEIT